MAYLNWIRFALHSHRGDRFTWTSMNKIHTLLEHSFRWKLQMLFYCILLTVNNCIFYLFICIFNAFISILCRLILTNITFLLIFPCIPYLQSNLYSYSYSYNFIYVVIRFNYNCIREWCVSCSKMSPITLNRRLNITWIDCALKLLSTMIF